MIVRRLIIMSLFLLLALAGWGTTVSAADTYSYSVGAGSTVEVYLPSEYSAVEFHIHLVDTKKVIITNTSGGTITLSSSSPFNMSYASAPALKHRFLSPGQNVDVTNSSGGTESITVDGVHDYARYDAQGDLSTFAKGSARGSKSILSMNRIAITNRDTTTIDVYGANGFWTFTDRVNPAVFYKSLSPGQSMEAVNMSATAFSLSLDSAYDYAIYESNGATLEEYKRNQASGMNYILKSQRISVTNSGTNEMTVAGPFDFDAFQVSNRSNPALFIRNLSTGSSLDATNQTPNSITLNATGPFDYTKYNSSGEVGIFGRDAKRLFRLLIDF